MNMVKNILVSGLALAAVSFAEDRDRNRCEALGTSMVNLKLAYVDETLWFGDKNLAKTDSQKVVRHDGYTDLVPVSNDFTYKIPYSVKAGCLVKKNVEYTFGEWSKNTKKWNEGGDNIYATTILDIHGNKTDAFDSTNAYNLLIVRQGDVEADSYSPDEMFVSKTYAFAFESWFAVAHAVKDSVFTRVEDGKDVTYTARRNYYSSSNAMDSAKVVSLAVSALKIPDEVKKIQVQVFHTVMIDPDYKEPVESSSSVVSTESSSSQTSVTLSSSSVSVASSSSATPVASSSSEKPVASSSSVKPVESSSSVTPAESSSSEGTLVMKSLQVAPAISGARQVRRLDGSVVKSNDAMKPGVYYVQGMDGLWKKQLVKTR